MFLDIKCIHLTCAAYAIAVAYGCEDGWHEIGNACFRRYDVSITWDEAKLACEYTSAVLASLNTDQGPDVARNVVETGQCWIGYHEVNGEWTWIEHPDGDPFINWATGTDGECAWLRNNKKMYGDSCSNSKQYICKKPMTASCVTTNQNVVSTELASDTTQDIDTAPETNVYTRGSIFKRSIYGPCLHGHVIERHIVTRTIHCQILCSRNEHCRSINLCTDYDISNIRHLQCELNSMRADDLSPSAFTSTDDQCYTYDVLGLL